MDEVPVVELEGQTSIEDALADAGHPWKPPQPPEMAGQLVLF